MIELIIYIIMFNIFFMIINFYTDILCLISYFIFRVIESICKNIFKILLRRGIISMITVLFGKLFINTNIYQDIICNMSNTDQLLGFVSAVFGIFIVWKSNALRILNYDLNERLIYLKKRKEYLRAKAESLGLDRDLDNGKDRQDLMKNEHFNYTSHQPFLHKCNEVEHMIGEEKTAEGLKRTIEYKVNNIPSEYGFYASLYFGIGAASAAYDGGCGSRR